MAAAEWKFLQTASEQIRSKDWRLAFWRSQFDQLWQLSMVAFSPERGQRCESHAGVFVKSLDESTLFYIDKRTSEPVKFLDAGEKTTETAAKLMCTEPFFVRMPDSRGFGDSNYMDVDDMQRLLLEHAIAGGRR